VSWRAVVTDTLVALAVVAGISVVIGAIESVSHVGNISNLYIIGIAALASRRGFYPALVASVLAFLTFDWFFIPPLHVFTVDDPGEYVALGTLLVTIVIIGQLFAVARTRAQEAHLRQRQTQLLYDVSHAALANSRMQPVYALALWRLNDTLGLCGSRLYLKEGDGLRQEASSGVLEEVADEAFWLGQAVDDGRLVAVGYSHATMSASGPTSLLTPRHGLKPVAPHQKSVSRRKFMCRCASKAAWRECWWLGRRRTAPSSAPKIASCWRPSPTSWRLPSSASTLPSTRRLVSLSRRAIGSSQR
jgi:hypothetical protein